MKRASVTLHDQIDIVEKRVRLEKLQLTVAIRGLRTSESVSVLGAFHASPAVKAALADRIH